MSTGEHYTFGQLVLSSSTGAVLCTCLMTPFDVVKTRIQAQSVNAMGSRCMQSVCAELVDFCWVCNPTQPALFRGTRDAFLTIARSEGLSSLWRGLPPSLLMSLPSTVLYYSAYETFKPSFASTFGPDLAAPLAGLTARAGVVIMVSPLELIRTNAQSLGGAGGSSIYSELAQRTHSMVLSQGITSLWRGLVPTLWRDLPFSAIYWGVYEKVKGRWTAKWGKPESYSTFFQTSFALGAFSGMVAATITTPFDVVKTHQQLHLETHQRPQPTMSQMAKIAKQNGLSGLFSGLMPRLAKVAPACAIMMGSFELGKVYWGGGQ